MAKQNYSAHQQKIISSYYDQIDTIMLDKLQNLCTELYLADSAAKQKRLWERVEKAMVNLKVPETVRSHILEKRDVTILAKNIQTWLKKS